MFDIQLKIIGYLNKQKNFKLNQKKINRNRPRKDRYNRICRQAC